MTAKEDFSLKEIKPNIQGGRASPDHKLSLVEHMQYLYVHVEALSHNLAATSAGSYVQLKVGNYQGKSGPLDMSNLRWDQVFAFNKDHLQAKTLEILVRDMMDSIIGKLSLVIGTFPNRTGDGCFAPEWHSLKDDNGHINGKILLAAWTGNQGDEAFLKAWHSDAASVSVDRMVYTRPKMYGSPKLWYLRVKVMEAQDLVPLDKRLEFFVRATLGGVVLRTQVSSSKTLNPRWSEELVFVAAEPFDDERLVLTVGQTDDTVQKSSAIVLGRHEIPLDKISKTLAPQPVSEQWVNLERSVHMGEEKMQVKFASKIRFTAHLDGLYHVFYEPAQFSSDLTATSPRLKPGKIGVLELGILKAEGLVPMKKRNGLETTDAFCLAKYGAKWNKTRTIAGSLAPKWNEQYIWEVYDPCTVITIGVFDNRDLQGENPPQVSSWKNSMIGKVRIRLSTLETDRIYAHAYPLVGVGPQGVKKKGELHLVIRFSCINMANLIYLYTQPLLPKTAYVNPLSVYQINTLRPQAAFHVGSWLQRAVPPIAREVVDNMLDTRTPVWSVRRARANFERVLQCLSGFVAVWKWFDDIRQWKNSVTSISIWLLFLLLVIYPQVILPNLFFYLALTGLKNYLKRPRHPPCLEAKLSSIENASADDFDEELDTFPSSAPSEVVRARYDRLRSIGQLIAGTLGDLANQLERVHSLLSWRDPRATPMFAVFCLIAGVIVYVVPFRLLLAATGIYLMRPPRLRVTLPPIPQNLLRRLPGKEDSMI